MANRAAAERPVLITVEVAAARLSLGRTTVYALLDRGELRAIHVGRALRVLAREVEAYAERLADQST
jgi:excisionase family DNA binding protein